MIDAFHDGGVMMWGITLAAVLMLGLSARAALDLRRVPDGRSRAVAGADAALFWGAFSSLLGVLGTLVGVMQAAAAIRRAGEVSAALAWAGVQVALITTVYGLLVLLGGLLLWGALRFAARRTVSSGTAA